MTPFQTYTPPRPVALSDAEREAGDAERERLHKELFQDRLLCVHDIELQAIREAGL
jgi:hypothetical protein